MFSLSFHIKNIISPPASLLLLIVVVHAANIQDRDGAMLVLGKAKGKFSRLQLIWADGGYTGKLIDWAKQFCNWILEIVKRSDDVKGFQD